MLVIVFGGSKVTTLNLDIIMVGTTTKRQPPAKKVYLMNSITDRQILNSSSFRRHAISNHDHDYVNILL